MASTMSRWPDENDLRIWRNVVGRSDLMTECSAPVRASTEVSLCLKMPILPFEAYTSMRNVSRQFWPTYGRWCHQTCGDSVGQNISPLLSTKTPLRKMVSPKIWGAGGERMCGMHKQNNPISPYYTIIYKEISLRYVKGHKISLS